MNKKILIAVAASMLVIAAMTNTQEFDTICYVEATGQGPDLNNLSSNLLTSSAVKGRQEAGLVFNTGSSQYYRLYYSDGKLPAWSTGCKVLPAKGTYKKVAGYRMAGAVKNAVDGQYYTITYPAGVKLPSVGGKAVPVRGASTVCTQCGLGLDAQGQCPQCQ